MTNLTQKFTRDFLYIGRSRVELKRFFIGSSPDYLGTLNVWYMAINDLYQKMPHDGFWEGTTIEIWDIESPDLLRFFEEKKQHLLDYDPNKEGKQTASELYFMGNSKKIAIAHFKNNKNVQTPIQFSIDVLSHGVGHMYHDICGFYDAESNNDISRELTNMYRRLRPTLISNSFHEDFAEVYRATFGGKQTMGKFSNGVLYKAPIEIYTLIENAFDLSVLLQDKSVEKLKIHGDYITWEEPIYFWWYKISSTLRAIKHGITFTLKDNKWVQD